MKKCVLDCQLGNCPQLLACDSIQTILIFFLGGVGGAIDPKKFTRVCMEFSKHNWATISEAIICLEMLIFGK